MKLEHELILKSVLLNKTNIEKERISEILEMKINWGEVAGILLNHRLGGYFYLGFDEKQRMKMPKEIREALKLLVKAQKEQQQLMIEEIVNVNNELTSSKIRFAAIKGAFFGSEMYEFGTRRSNDMDLLVYEDDLEKLDVSLRKLGYVQSFMPNGKMIEATKKEKLIQRMNYHDLVPYMKEISSGILELDINFLFDGKENLVDSKVYNLGTQLYEGKNYNIVGLNMYTNLAFLCVHFHREATNTIWTESKRDVILYKLVDIINFVRFYGYKMNTVDLLKVLEELNVTEKAFFTFKIIEEFYDDEYINELIGILELKIPDKSFMHQVYDHGKKTRIERKKSFYESAFSFE